MAPHEQTGMQHRRAKKILLELDALEQEALQEAIHAGQSRLLAVVRVRRNVMKQYHLSSLDLEDIIASAIKWQSQERQTTVFDEWMMRHDETWLVDDETT